jgi:MFS family permease
MTGESARISATLLRMDEVVPLSLKEVQANSAATDRRAPTPLAMTILFASAMTVLAGAIVASAGPLIETAFKVHPHIKLLAKQVVTLPALAIAIISPMSGWLLDRIGRRTVLLGGLVLYAIAGTTGAFVNSIEWLLVSRAVLGVAVAMVMTSCTTLIGDYFTGAARTKFLGLQAGFMSMGGVTFLFGGGLLATALGWHGPFYVYLLAVPVFIAALMFVREPVRQTQQLAAQAPLNIGLTATICGILGLWSAGFYLIPTQLPFLLNHEFHVTPLVSGACGALVTLAISVVALNYGKLAKRVSRKWIVTLVPVGMGLSLAVIGLAMNWPMMIAGLICFGLSCGPHMPTLSGWLMSVTPEAMRGRAVGVFGSSLFIGQFLSPLVVSPIATATSERWAFVIVGAMLVMSSGLCYLAVRKG